VGFLIEVPTSFSSIEKLAKKWQMAHTERHPPKEIGRARSIFFLNVGNAQAITLMMA